jgi:hypothetical protein
MILRGVRFSEESLKGLVMSVDVYPLEAIHRTLDDASDLFCCVDWGRLV